MRPFPCALVSLLAAALAAPAPTARAQPDEAPIPPARPVTVRPGPVVLPIAGLKVTLPKDRRPGFTWSLTSSYALADEGGTYDGRDVLDEKIDDRLVAGTWVMTGHFDAGPCATVLAGTALEDAWSEERTLYGLPFTVRGGIYDFQGDLGKVPAALLCSEREGRQTLLMYRYFIDATAAGSREAILALLPKQPLLQRVARAWRDGRAAPSAPRHRPEVRDRGSVPAVRTVTLARSGLTVALPDDGFVWLVRRPAPEDAVDWLVRMAPAHDELSFELAQIPGATCAEVFAGFTAETRRGVRPRRLPPGWLAGPTLVVDGALERTACRDAGGAAVVVGLFNVPDKGRAAGDFGPLRPMLDAIAAAAAAP